MKLPRNPLTAKEFHDAVNDLMAECEKGPDGALHHKGCGGIIRIGHMKCFKTEDAAAGTWPLTVPYCDKCDVPDGPNHTYSTKVGILPESPKRPPNCS